MVDASVVLSELLGSDTPSTFYDFGDFGFFTRLFWGWVFGGRGGKGGSVVFYCPSETREFSIHF